MLDLNTLLTKSKVSADLLPIQSASTLLNQHQKTLASIKNLVGVPDKHWRLLYQPLFNAFAEFVQQVPASEAHHHCDIGGHLRHSLEVVDLSLRQRRAYVLPPGKEPEEVAEEADVWTFAVTTAALLHDMGKPMVDQNIFLHGRDGLPLQVWSPWVGSMRQTKAKYYRIEFRRDRNYHLHEAVAPLLAGYLIPSDGVRWLGQHKDALAAWLTAVGNHTVGNAVIATIVKEADQLSAGNDLSGQRSQIATARTKPLAERLLVELRQLLDNGTLPMNRKGAAAFVDDNAVWLVSKRCLDALKESMKAQGQSGIPTRNDRLMDELQQRGIAVATNEDKAIWNAQVCVPDGDQEWKQSLTLLRVPIDHIWPNNDSRPELPKVAITHSESEQNPSSSLDDASESVEPTASPAAAIPPLDPPQVLNVERSDPVGDVEMIDLERQILMDDLESVIEAKESNNHEPTMTDIHLDDLPESIETNQTPSDPSPANKDKENLGQEFLVWLVEGLKTGSLAINTAKAKVHVVQEGLLLVSPAVFRAFDNNHWLNAQKRFLKLKMTARTPNGENIFHYDVNGDRNKKTVKGIVINNPGEKLSVSLPKANSVLSAKEPLT